MNQQITSMIILEVLLVIFVPWDFLPSEAVTLPSTASKYQTTLGDASYTVVTLTTTSRIDFFDAAAICARESPSSGLPILTATNTAFPNQLTQFLINNQSTQTFVPLGLNIRRVYLESPTLATFSNAWQAVLLPTSRAFYETPPAPTTTIRHLCLAYTLKPNTTDGGIKAVSCDGQFDAFQLFCQAAIGICSSAPELLSTIGPGAVVAFSSTPFAAGTTATYSCNMCNSTLRLGTPNDNGTSVCFGTLGWRPAIINSRCEAHPPVVRTTMSNGETLKLHTSESFSGSVIEAAKLCNSRDRGAGLVRVSNISMFNAVTQFLDQFCEDGVYPIAPNIIQSFPNGENTSQAIIDAWAAKLPAGIPRISPSVLWNSLTQGECTVIRKDPLTSAWVVDRIGCKSNIPKPSRLLCQTNAAGCPLPPWSQYISALTGDTYDSWSWVSFGTNVTYRCPFSLPDKALTTKTNMSQCYGSFGWFDKVQNPCSLPPICEYGGREYAIFRPSSGQGILNSAAECYTFLNGALFEHRTKLDTVAMLKDAGLTKCYSGSEEVYVAPTAWAWKDNLTATAQKPSDAEGNDMYIYSDGSTPNLTLADLSLDFHLNEFCLRTKDDGKPADKPCWEDDRRALCVVNATEEEKSCRTLPRNPTEGSAAVANLTYISVTSPNNTYLYGTTATFRCPCFHEWGPPNSTGILPPDSSAPGPNTVRLAVTCYGSLGWGYFSLTSCVPNDMPSVTTSMGTVVLPMKNKPYTGNHFRAIDECSSVNRSLGLVKITNESDFLAITTLMADFCVEGDIPIANNIIQTVYGEMTQSKFNQAWNEAFPGMSGSQFAPGLPAYNTSHPQLCSVISRSGTTYTVKVKDCAEDSTSNAMACISSNMDCLRAPRWCSVSNVTNYTTTSSSFRNGTIATHDCYGCRKWSTTNTAIFEPKLTCYSSLGWYPRITGAECVGPDVCNFSGYDYMHVGLSSEEDIIDGASKCFQNYNGSLYEHREGSVTSALVAQMKAYLQADRACLARQFSEPYVAPTSWRFKELVPASRNLTFAEVQQFWKYANGSAPDLGFFTSTFLDNWGGIEQCIFVRNLPEGFFVRDTACHQKQSVLCQVNSPSAACSYLPVVPTNGSSSATMTLPANATAPYPFGTIVEFTCPCGHKWADGKPGWRQSASPNPFGSSVTVKKAMCLGALDWDTYNVTSCVSLLPILPKQVNLTNGTGHVALVPFIGDHMAMAIECHRQNNSWSLPTINSSTDLLGIEHLLKENCVQGDIPVSQHILRLINPSNVTEDQFLQAWNLTVKASLWHPGEPSWNQSNVPACAVLSLRNGIWKLSARSCYEPLNATGTLCFEGSSGSNCSSDDLPRPETVSLLTNGHTRNDVSFVFSTVTTNRCPCGYLTISTADPWTPIANTNCYGSLGWFPRNIPDCHYEAPPSTTVEGKIFMLANMSLTGTIFDAEAACHQLGPTVGLPQLETDVQLAELTRLVKIHCRDGPFPLANDILQAKQPYIETDINVYKAAWISSVRDSLWTAGEPSFNASSVKFCSMVARNGTEFKLKSVSCNEIMFEGSIVCQNGTGVCTDRPPYKRFLTNLTNGHVVTDQVFSYNTTAYHECPGNKFWSTINSTILSPPVTCQGSLGWYPNVEATCLMEGECYHKGTWYTVRNESSNSSILQGADVCYGQNSGGVVEIRNTTEAIDLLEALVEDGCLAEGEHVFVAPTAWAYKDDLPVNRSLNGTLVGDYWKFIDGTALSGSLFNDSEPSNSMGTEWCLRVDPTSGKLLDSSCTALPNNQIRTLCRMNATSTNMTGCSSQPRIPTAISVTSQAKLAIPPAVNGTYQYGTLANFSCPCGHQWAPVNTSLPLVPFMPLGGNETTRHAKCLGTLGWANFEVTSCIPVPKMLQFDGDLYSIVQLNNSSEGVFEAAKLCQNQSGSLAEPSSAELITRIGRIMELHCLNISYLGLTSWSNMPGSLQKTNTTLSTSADIVSVWRYFNGLGINSSLPFLPNEPNNAQGQEQCMAIASGPNRTFGLMDVPCVKAVGLGHAICHLSQAKTSCPPPTNPTNGRAAIEAQVDFGPLGNLSSYPFGSRVNFVCPSGYTWAPTMPWPSLNYSSNGANSTLNQSIISVECLGTLGWTLYDVSYCQPVFPVDMNATCGPLIPLDYSRLICNVTCRNTSTGLWFSGASSHNITCYSNGTCDSLNDTCTPPTPNITCDPALIGNFTGVSLTWEGPTLGNASWVTYSCPPASSFDGSTSSVGQIVNVTCSNRTWSAIPANIACVPLWDCDPAAIPNYSVLRREYGSNRPGDYVVFYFPHDVEWYTCQSNGYWNQSRAPKCKFLNTDRDSNQEHIIDG